MTKLLRSLWTWYIISLVWCPLVVLLALLTLFRALKTSGAGQIMQFDDVPLLRMAEVYYPHLLWAAAGLAAALLPLLAAACSQTQRTRHVPRAGTVQTGWKTRPTRRAYRADWLTVVGLPVCAGLAVAIALAGCRYSASEGRTGAQFHPLKLAGLNLDYVLAWAFVILGTAAGWGMTQAICKISRGFSPRAYRPRSEGTPWPVRLGVVFLLGFVAMCVEAVWFHSRFWNRDLNGHFNYQQFFVAGEIPSANMVLYSCSALFASVAALAGCSAYVLFHALVGRVFQPVHRNSPRTRLPDGLENPSYETRRVGSPSYRLAAIPVIVAVLWAIALCLPWQIKLLPDIRTFENGWIMPGLALVLLPAGLAPLLAVNFMMMVRDFRYGQVAWGATATDPPRPPELALWAMFLFPFYPLVRSLPLPPRWRSGLLMLLSGGIIGGLMLLVVKVDDWFKFDDWRHMLRDAEFPFLKTWFSLMAACFVYLCLRRAVGLFRVVAGWALRRDSAVVRAAQPDSTVPQFPQPNSDESAPNSIRPGSLTYDSLTFWPARLAYALVMAAAIACIGIASWPFWGWNHVSKNVMARCVEFNHRHEFELSFLHWLLDCDRDGYAVVLHGGDPNDFDSSIQGGGLGAPEKIALPVDRFEVDKPARAKRFPNLVVLYLEGVVPRSIGAYGERSLPDDLPPTPNMDSVAAEGTIFTQARCFYPSTWDAWFATCSGRYLRTAGMSSTELTGDHYSPHGNLYHVLKLAGIDRYCHHDTAPYYDMLVPKALYRGGKPPWKLEAEFNSSLTAQEDKDGLWRGDKRMDRMVDFVDSLKPGERFFITEHMCDTHFPWKATPLPMAQKLGFPDGLEPYGKDADRMGLPYDNYRLYLQSITRMDAQIGRLLTKLRERKLYDNTMIVIVSDHGCQFWEHEHIYYVSHLYEQAIRIPLIIRVPGLPGGRRCDEPVLHADILPTVMDVAGVRHANVEEAGELPGRSLLPVIRGKGPLPDYRHRDVPMTTHYDMLGVMHDFHYKLIFQRPSGTYLLFDLEKDPGETENLTDSRPDLLEEMMQRLRKAFKENKSLTGKIE